MFTIGLTGGIGSGKSTVASIFKALGVPVFDTDAIARQLVASGEPALTEIIQVFGEDIVDTDGKLDREKLKHRVFNNQRDKQKLEAILHPRIREALLVKIKDCSASYCIAVIPLLVEQQWQQLVDRVLVVDTNEDTQVRRTKQRDNMPESLVRSIIGSQVNRETRLAAADDVIDNSRDSDLLDEVHQLHKKYLAMALAKQSTQA